MKLRLLILCLFACAVCHAQGPPLSSYTPISSRYNWLAGYFRALHIPAGCGAPSLQIGQWPGAGAVYLDSCSNTPYYYSSGTWTAFGTGGGGTGGLSGGNLGTGFRIYHPPSQGTKTLFNGYAVLIDSSSNTNGLTFKIDSFNIATRAFRDKLKDSLGAVKQATLVSGTNIKTVNGSSLLGSGDLALSGSTNTSIGGGHKVAVNSTNNIKSLKAKYAVNLDSLISGEVGIGADSSLLATIARLNKVKDSLMSIIAVLPSDTSFLHMNHYCTPNDGLQDSVGWKQCFADAAARNKNVYIDGGQYEVGCSVTPAAGVLILGVGGNFSIIHQTKDSVKTFKFLNGNNSITGCYFLGIGRGPGPGAEVFTESDAIYIGSDNNKVYLNKFFRIKGSAITKWAFSTIYYNHVFENQIDSCGQGLDNLTNSEYSYHFGNHIINCSHAIRDGCGGNTMWWGNIIEYNGKAGRIYGSTGCNGDHSFFNMNIVNHNTGSLDIEQLNNEYDVSHNKFYFTDINVGSVDTTKRLIMVGNTYSGITVTISSKVIQSQISGGTVGSSAVTWSVSGSADISICNIMNSVYAKTVCGTIMGTATRNLQATDSLRAVGVPFSNNDTALFHALTMNKITGAIAWANFVGSGGSSYTFSTGLTNTSGTITNNLSTGVSGGQTMIGSTGTTSGLTIKASSGVGAGANNAFRVIVGNNGAVPMLQLFHNGSFSIGDDAFDGFGYIKMPVNGLLIREMFGSNVAYVNTAGDWQFGKSGSSVHFFQGKTFFGGTSTATANVHAAASTTSEASLRIPNGTAPTSPNQGDIWQASNNLMFRSNDGNNYQLNNTILENDYTPTASNTANITGSVAVGNFHYIRNGNSVRVWGTCSATITAANTATTFELSLPIASTFTLPQDAVGSGAGAVNNAVQHSVVVVGVTTTVLVSTVATTTGNRAMYFDWNYIVK
jgi:hypothetical protein